MVYLHSLNFQFHVILPGSFPVLPLLPAVSVPSVANFLARVEKHRPGLWPKFKLYKTWQGKIQLLVTDTPYLNFLRQPVMVTVKGDQHRCNFLEKYQQNCGSFENYSRQSILPSIVFILFQMDLKQCDNVFKNIDIGAIIFGRCSYQVVITQQI